MLLFNGKPQSGQVSEGKHQENLICFFYSKSTFQMINWDLFSEKGPNAYIIKFPVRAIEM